ncbi:hypothetical protein ACTS9V_06030 [Empedobacter falsenii]|uniref:hypothetical protein n=1 Tax=Empedobacter sp. GD03797 TaxID=2975382 RepID=UPI00244A848A|nr:hypothetical protein [Empedobacter sp. GD03797]MDH1882754.1 hypothetical protein [Empedobacter sp. GD03797]
MNTKGLVILASFFLAAYSCNDKKERSKESDDSTEDAVIVPGIKVTINAIVPQSDTLQIYYRLNPTEDYISKQSVNAIVNGSDSAQNIIFNIPGNDKITDFRFDIGNNKNQGNIQFKNFRMELNGKSFVTNDTMFIQYFNPNDQVEYDRKTSTAKIVKGKSNTYDPLFIPRAPLSEEINKLYK